MQNANWVLLRIDLLAHVSQTSPFCKAQHVNFVPLRTKQYGDKLVNNFPIYIKLLTLQEHAIGVLPFKFSRQIGICLNFIKFSAKEYVFVSSFAPSLLRMCHRSCVVLKTSLGQGWRRRKNFGGLLVWVSEDQSLDENSAEQIINNAGCGSKEIVSIHMINPSHI